MSRSTAARANRHQGNEPVTLSPKEMSFVVLIDHAENVSRRVRRRRCCASERDAGAVRLQVVVAATLDAWVARPPRRWPRRAALARVADSSQVGAFVRRLMGSLSARDACSVTTSTARFGARDGRGVSACAELRAALAARRCTARCAHC
jgi:hypothetical protein